VYIKSYILYFNLLFKFTSLFKKIIYYRSWYWFGFRILNNRLCT